MKEVVVQNHLSAIPEKQIEAQFGSLRLPSKVNPSVSLIDRREKLLRSFNHRFDVLQDSFISSSNPDSKNLQALLTIAHDPEFDFNARAKDNFRTPLGRILAFADMDPAFNFGGPYLPLETMHLAADKVLRVIFSKPNHISKHERLSKIYERMDSLAKSGPSADTEIKTRTEIAKDLLRAFIVLEKDISTVLLDSSHRYLDEIRNLEIVDFLIENGLQLFKFQYPETGIEGTLTSTLAAPSHYGFKLMARVMFSLNLSEDVSSLIADLRISSLIPTLKEHLAKSIAAKDFFLPLEDGRPIGETPCDPVELILDCEPILSRDRHLLELLKVAHQQNYNFRRHNEDGMNLLENLSEHLFVRLLDYSEQLEDRTNLGPIPEIPFESIDFLIKQKVDQSGDFRGNIHALCDGYRDALQKVSSQELERALQKEIQGLCSLMQNWN